MADGTGSPEPATGARACAARVSCRSRPTRTAGRAP